MNDAVNDALPCPYAEVDAAYVLGSLAPAERLDFERHLPGCAACSQAVRELAGLPGLLARVDPAVLAEPPVEEPVPPDLLPRLVREVRRDRRRRWVVSAGLAAAAAVVAGVGTAAWVAARDEPTPATPPAASGEAMSPVDGAPVRATLALQQVAWGTKLDLACTYAPGPEADGGRAAPTYVLYVRTRDGRLEQVGTWRSIEDRTMRLAAATSVARTDISTVEVRTENGRTVLRLRG